MKQTNNAIKFLMAQYRAIFRNANLKMFLAAATAAAALSAGQAQAAGVTNWSDIEANGAYDGTTASPPASTDKKLEIVGNATDAQNTNDGFKITVSGKGHFIKGGNGKTTFSVKDTESSITLTGDAKTTDLTIGNATPADADVANITINELNNYGGKLAIYGGDGNATSHVTANTIRIGEEAQSTSVKAAGETKALVELGKNAVLGDKTKTTGFTITTGGELKFAGANSQAESSQGIKLDGGKVNVADAAGGVIVGGLNILSGELNVSGGTTGSTLSVQNGLKVTSGTVTVAGGTKAGTLNLEGDLTVEGGTVKLTTGDSGGALVVDGKTKFSGEGKLDIASKGALTLKGDTSFASGSVSAIAKDAKVTVDTSTRGVTLDIYEADLKQVMGSTFAASGNNDFIVKISDPGELDLAATKLVDESNGKSAITMTTGNGAATIKGEKAKYLKGLFDSKTGYDFNTLTVGTKDAFNISGSATVTVHDAITVSGDKTKTNLTVTSGSLILSAKDTAEHTVGAKTLTLNGGAKAQANVEVNNGTWNVDNVTVTKGKVAVNNSTLNVAGKLSIADAEGEVAANAATINLIGEKSDLSSKTANTVKLSNTSTLNIKASDVFTVKDGAVSMNTTDFAKNVVSGDSSSVLNLSGAGTLSKADLKTVVDGIGFGGIVTGITLANADKPTDGVDISTDMAGSDAYKDVVVSVKDPVTGPYSVEGVKLKDPAATELVIGSASAAGSMTLNNPQSGKFVTDAKGEKVAGVKLDNAKSALVLAGSGEIGAIDTPTAGQGSVTIGQLDKGGNVTVGQIGKTAAVGTLTINENVNVTAKGDIKVNDFIFNGNKLSASGHAITVGGADVSVGSVNVPRVVDIMGDVDAKSLTIDASQKKVSIAGGAHVTLESLTASADATTIFVGQDGKDGLEAVVDVGALVLGGATLAVDPDYGNPSALVFAKGFNDAGAKNDKDAGVVNGKIIVGQNSAVAVGFDSEADARLVLNEYLINNNGFADPNAAKPAPGLVANALVLNKHLSVGQNDGILVDSSAKNIDPTNPVVSGNKVEFKGKSALVVTDNVYTVGAGGKKEGSAITFTHSAKGTVALSNDTQIILAGDFDAADDGIQFFSGSSAANNPTVTISGAGKVNVVSSNELLSGELDTATGKLTNLQFQDNGKVYRDASAPVTEIMLNKVQGKYKANAGKGFAGYDYLTALSNGTSAAGLDKLTHAATFAGAQQAAVASVTTMAEAVGGRVGALGVEAASIAATGSQANGGVWVTPMYKSVDADGFAAQGTTYGSDIDLAGVTFGADTVNGNMRFGAAFNIGSGKAEGKGQGEGLKDDFDYYGFGIYSAMGFGNFALVGDASLNVISHDVEGYSGVEEFGTAKGKADTTAVTMGVTGQYTISSPMVDVTPHLGARFIRLDTDSYDVNTNKGVVASTDFDVQNVFSIPLGVSLSKAFEMGGWSLAPSADLTITFNTGDTDAKSNSYITGVENASFTTEVLDEVTYGVALGLGAQYGAFGTQIGINYTGSENTDAFGVNANARYMF